jgi:hypothetical protein
MGMHMLYISGSQQHMVEESIKSKFKKVVYRTDNDNYIAPCYLCGEEKSLFLITTPHGFLVDSLCGRYCNQYKVKAAIIAYLEPELPKKDLLLYMGLNIDFKVNDGQIVSIQSAQYNVNN